jgi:molybdenum cofactor synthesis domain-containing protein
MRPQIRTELVKAAEAGGRVAAEDFESRFNVPPFPISHMDGYAVIASDLRKKGTQKALALKGEARLGDARVLSMKTGETIRIPTGGRLPVGADAVVPVEEARRRGRRVYFSGNCRVGNFVYATGSDVKKGKLILTKGRAIRAQDVGMLLSLGVDRVRVFARPRVALIATGSELTNDSGQGEAGRVRNSHTQIFASLIRENGGEVVDLGIAPDDEERIASALKAGIQEADLMLTLGGASLGKSDFVERAVRSLVKDAGIIHGIRMDRGRVTGVAEVQGKPVVMMPGPIQAAMNAFLIFALPFMAQLSGESPRFEPVLQARLSKSWEARNPFHNFTKVLYVKLRRRRSGISARPMTEETESMNLMTSSDGFVIVPERVVKLRAGTEVTVKLLSGFSYVIGGFPC